MIDKLTPAAFRLIDKLTPAAFRLLLSIAGLAFLAAAAWAVDLRLGLASTGVALILLEWRIS